MDILIITSFGSVLNKFYCLLPPTQCYAPCQEILMKTDESHTEPYRSENSGFVEQIGGANLKATTLNGNSLLLVFHIQS
jgi:hypothetical protein